MCKNGRSTATYGRERERDSYSSTLLVCDIFCSNIRLPTVKGFLRELKSLLIVIWFVYATRTTSLGELIVTIYKWPSMKITASVVSLIKHHRGAPTVFSVSQSRELHRLDRQPFEVSSNWLEQWTLTSLLKRNSLIGDRVERKSCVSSAEMNDCFRDGKRLWCVGLAKTQRLYYRSRGNG